ncbi:MAG: phosphoribosyltransferase domain-containing protein [Hormoscilla sp. GUM202]|nr:phosphoribosyltransferase domain-containing protein [Hormoscilla sp. GUM202]
MNSQITTYHLQRENNPRRQTALSFPFLGQLGLTSEPDLLACRKHLQELLRSSACQKPISGEPLIIGLAESGIIPSGLMHQVVREQQISAGWICSTRRRASGIRFMESHSHSPHHILPLPQFQPSQLWFVEDEITTGRTILNLALHLCSLLQVRQMRFFTIADSRSPAQIAQFESILADRDIQFSTHTLIPLPPDRQDIAQNLQHQDIIISEDMIVTEPDEIQSQWQLPEQRAALQTQWHIVPDLANNLQGSLLAIGEAIDLALRMVRGNPQLSFQQITLNPWRVDGINIQHRLDICDKYYLYNYKHLKSPIYLLYDPHDRAIASAAKKQLSQAGFTVNDIIF